MSRRIPSAVLLAELYTGAVHCIVDPGSAGYLYMAYATVVQAASGKRLSIVLAPDEAAFRWISHMHDEVVAPRGSRWRSP